MDKIVQVCHTLGCAKERDTKDNSTGDWQHWQWVGLRC